MLGRQKMLNIDWSKISCNTCRYGGVHVIRNGCNVGCPTQKQCDRKFSLHAPHKKYTGPRLTEKAIA